MFLLCVVICLFCFWLLLCVASLSFDGIVNYLCCALLCLVCFFSLLSSVVFSFVGCCVVLLCLVIVCVASSSFCMLRCFMLFVFVAC